MQELLIGYTSLIKDINDVRCSATSGDDISDRIVSYLTALCFFLDSILYNSNVFSKVRDLRRTEICVSSDENSVIHPLDILNIILAILIFLIIGKLLYDYWSFKKTGKLPWIVAKIP